MSKKDPKTGSIAGMDDALPEPRPNVPIRSGAARLGRTGAEWPFALRETRFLNKIVSFLVVSS